MKFLKHSLVVLVVLSLSSCDLLEDREPQESITFPGQLQTPVQVENAIIGAYNDIQDGSFTGSQTLVFGEIIADNTVWTGSFTTYQQIAQKAMNATNGSIEGLWNDGYVAINSANIILASLENIDDPDFDATSAEGEAKFIRALSHFSLLQFFAESPYVVGQTNDQPGVPVILEPTTTPADFKFPSRSSVADVYAAVISDLQDAINLLPASNTDGRATSWAAKALLSRVYMQQSEFESARDMAGDVVNNGPFRLNNDVLTFFRTEFSPESIFEIAHTVDDNPGVNQALAAFYNVGARDDIQLSESFITAAGNIVTDDQQTELNTKGQTAEDTRITDLTTAPSLAEATTSSNSAKYEKETNTDDNAPILRLPEVTFNYIEAQTRLATSIATVPQEVFDLLNEVRNRAFIVRNADGDIISDESSIEFDRTDFTDKQQLIDAILLERRIELAFEGQRLGDLQRLQQDITGLPFDSDAIAFPIPQDEIDANPNITQNPAYRN